MRALVVVPDLLFQSRIESALRARGIEFEAPADQGSAETAAGRASLMLIDLQADGFAVAALIRAARDAGAAVLAFGRHTDAATLRQAREAGADIVVPRSQLAEELSELVDRLLASAAERGAQTARARAGEI